MSGVTANCSSWSCAQRWLMSWSEASRLNRRKGEAGLGGGTRGAGWTNVIIGLGRLRSRNDGPSSGRVIELSESRDLGNEEGDTVTVVVVVARTESRCGRGLAMEVPAGAFG